MTAPFVVEGAVTTAVMEAYIQHVLLPTLRGGDIVTVDGLTEAMDKQGAIYGEVRMKGLIQRLWGTGSGRAAPWRWRAAN